MLDKVALLAHSLYYSDWILEYQQYYISSISTKSQHKLQLHCLLFTYNILWLNHNHTNKLESYSILYSNSV